MIKGNKTTPRPKPSQIRPTQNCLAGVGKAGALIERFIVDLGSCKYIPDGKSTWLLSILVTVQEFAGKDRTSQCGNVRWYIWEPYLEKYIHTYNRIH